MVGYRQKTRQTARQSARRTPTKRNIPQDATNPGLVVAGYGAEVIVESADGLTHCRVRKNAGRPVCGDHVEWALTGHDNEGVVTALHPRHALLTRPRGERMVAMAANIDRIIGVFSPAPRFDPLDIDRLLVSAAHLHIAAGILLNKIDLLNDEDTHALDAVLERYRALDYPVWQCSARSGAGMVSLQDGLRGRVSILVGPSGVGKSTLANCLIPDLDQRTGVLSATGDRGRHTTTSARLFHLPGGGDLIDSPGFNAFDISHLGQAEIAAGFIEFSAFAAQCRFRDCRHLEEPGCAVIAAAAAGRLHPGRLENYRQLLGT